MIRNGEITTTEVKRILGKYWWVLPLTVIAGATLGLGSTFFIPKKFTSQARVQIHEQTVSSDLVKPVLTEATNQRVASMQEQILSRTQLQAIIEKLGLYQAQRATAHMEDLVLKLRSRIEVTAPDNILGFQNNRQLPGFYIDVTFDNPQQAQQICSEITTKFLEQNAKYMNDKSAEAVEFLAQQAEDAKHKLDEQDAKLAEFQKKNMGALPDQEASNLSLLQTENAQLEANTQAINRAQQDKAMNESLLASQLGVWKAMKSSGDGTAPETLDKQLSSLQEQLAILQSRYTPEHPDVIKTRNQIEQLKKRMADAPKPAATPSPVQSSEIEPLAIQQLRAKLKQDDLNMADLNRRQTQIQNQIGALQGRIQMSPAVEQEFKELTRSHQSAMDSYNDLLKRHDQAKIARDLTQRQEGEQFSMEDPPSLPMSPSFPKKTIFTGGGLAAGLALGLAILYLLAAMDSSMHTERDVEVCLKLPVLALLPSIDPMCAVQTNGNKQSRELKLAGTAR